MYTKQVVAYCRVSTDKQDNARQRADLQAWADRMGWQLLGFVDEVASGASSARPKRAELIAIAKQPTLTPTSLVKLSKLLGHPVDHAAQRIDAILIHEPSRWSRSMVDHVMTLHSLAGHGVSVISLNGLSLDVSTPEGRLMTTVFAALAEFERDLLSRRVKSGMAHAASQGRRAGRPKDKSALMAIAPQCHALKQDGMPISQIASKLSVSRPQVYRALACYEAMSEPLK
jgi:putative DNA-invertase from lambdoid prophage Rac